ncbi:class I SAM-dependent methyltransferase [Eubacteriales bacterium mix99]|jgi:tRNA (adenine22-N1)-methyltransferase
MALDGRLKAIADAVPKSHKVADIGTDHGYVPLALLQDHRIEYAVAADISTGSLNKAERLIRLHHMEYCMETRLGDGLSVLAPWEADTIIITGMGGLLISDILEKGEAVARTASVLVLQPMTAQEELRRWLISNEYGIADEELVQEGRRIYEILIAAPGRAGTRPEADIYYDIGWKLVEKNHPLLGELIRDRIQTMEEIIQHLKNGKTEAARIRQKELEGKVRQYKEVAHCHVK